MDMETRVGHRWWGSSTTGSEEGRGPRPAEVGNQGSVENSRVEYVLLEGGLTTGPGRLGETLRAQGNRSVVTQAKMGSVDQHRPQLSVMVEIFLSHPQSTASSGHTWLSAVKRGHCDPGTGIMILLNFNPFTCTPHTCHGLCVRQRDVD